MPIVARWNVAKSWSIRGALAAPLVPRWTIAAVLALLWAVDVSSIVLDDCARHATHDPCYRYMVYAQAPGLFIFPYVLGLLVLAPTQSFVLTYGVVLAMCAGLYAIARRVLPPRLSLVNLAAVLIVWIASSAAGIWMLFAGGRLLSRF